jgi:hypothetical protein
LGVDCGVLGLLIARTCANIGGVRMRNTKTKHVNSFDLLMILGV